MSWWRCHRPGSMSAPRPTSTTSPLAPPPPLHRRGGARQTARVILDHIAARARASKYREVRTRFKECTAALLAEAHNRFGVVSPLGGPTSSGMVTLHCPPAQLYALARFLRSHGAATVSVASLDYVLDRDNPLFAKLEAFLRQ